MYRLEYLSIARQDMVEIVRYISHELENPEAAQKLAAELLEAADKLVDFPYINMIYAPIRPLKREYRKILVQNYTLFYWVEGQTKTVTIARVLYSRRD